MEVRSLFPKWHKLSPLNDAWWSTKVDLTDANAFYGLLSRIIEQQAVAANNRPSAFLPLCEAITADIVELQTLTEEGSDTISLEYLQFESTILPLQQTMNAGELHKSHDWIVNGFSYTASSAISREFDATRPRRFLDCRVPWVIKNCRFSLSEWFSSFFYYCRVRSALHEVADALLEASLMLVEQFSTSAPERVNVLRSVLDWSASQNHDIAPRIAALLEAIFNSEAVSTTAIAKIGVSFSTRAGRFSSRLPSEWAAWTLENVPDELVQHERFQLLMATIDSKSDWLRKRETIETEIERVIECLLLDYRLPASAALLRDQRIGLLNSLVFMLHKFELSDDLLRMLCTWYETDIDCRMHSGVLFFLPIHTEGMAYLGSNRSQLISMNSDRSEAIGEITMRTNEALSVGISLQSEKLLTGAPCRPGVPDYNKGAEFERALREFYRINELSAALLQDSVALVSFPAFPHPLQALMRSEVGRALPISASLERPEADRRIKSVALWSAGNDFYSEMEVEALSTMFNDVDVRLSVYSGTINSKGDFAELYQNPEFDLIWLVGHGSYDHWEPTSPAIILGDHSSVSIDEILSWKLRNTDRRLLVLNICDGGAAATIGGIHRIGLAAMLACRQQAVATHHWPVEPRSAAAFGLLFAKHLADAQSYSCAFEKTLDDMRLPWSNLVDQLSDLAGHDILDRLANIELDTNNILHWGSPCLFQ